MLTLLDDTISEKASPTRRGETGTPRPREAAISSTPAEYVLWIGTISLAQKIKLALPALTIDGIPALEAGINFIRLATPTTDDVRLPVVLNNTSGFVYYVSITGTTAIRLVRSG